VNSSPLAIGSERGGVADFFKGVIDEVAIYRRALPQEEVLAAFHTATVEPCRPGAAPFIVGQPFGQTVLEGATFSLDVVASGSPPLFYQWFTDQGLLLDATNSVLSFTSIALNQSGNYHVVVSNSVGAATSEVARVVVVPPPSILQVVDARVPGGGTANVPIQMVTQGSENALGFSLAVNPSVLRFVEANLAEDLRTHAALILNTNQVASGRLGVAVALSAGAAFSKGTQQVLRVTFEAVSITPQTASVGFTDDPTTRQVSDRVAKPVPTVYVAGSIEIYPAEFEGDVAPRPDGDRTLGIIDWVQVGRFAAGLDEVLTNEFQRVDCAPLSQRGNGIITVGDWVQAGRFAAGLDSPAVVGGPIEPQPEAPAGGGFAAASSRELSFAATNVVPGGTVTVPVQLAAQGNENAMGFSIGFDTNKLRYVSAAEAPGLGQATLILNPDDAGVGRVGVVLALPTGAVLPTGLTTLLSLRFQAATNVAGTTPLELVDTPVVRETVDARATSLAVTYTNGVIVFGLPGPRLTVTRSGAALILIWPVAPGYELHSSTAAGGATWSKVPIPPIEIGGQMLVSLSVTGSQQFFRLVRP
jgi:hypothetical protein